MEQLGSSFRAAIKLHVVTGGPPDSVLRRRVREPVTLGLPFPRSFCSLESALTLVDGAGAPHPIQARPVDLWSDGSIRWLLVDFQADAPASYELRVGTNGRAIAPDHPIEVSQASPGDLTIDTGAARFHMRADGRFPFDSVLIDSRQAIDAAATDLRIQDGSGAYRPVRIATIALEEVGPLRTAVVVSGIVGAAEEPYLLLTARLHFFAASPTVRFVVALQNPRRARHPGGFWELGDKGSVLLKDVSFTFRVPSDAPEPTVYCCCDQDALGDICRTPVEVYQESSGGENWDSSVHLNRHGVVPHRLRGYRVRWGDQERSGLRASPVLALQSEERLFAVSMPYFWQNFPKAVETDGRSVTLRLWPGQYPDLHEIQGGEQKTHSFYVAFGPDAVTGRPLAWTHSPLLIHAESEWYCSTDVVPYLTPVTDDPNEAYLRLVNAAIEGPNTFEQKRELIDEYGWRHFGEIYADHEAVFHQGERPLVSHYNNQYDAVAGFAYQFLRSGDPRWWTHMAELAAHVIDIDIYHTDRDKAAYNHGLFWHTLHYTDAATATHRAYPKAPAVAGGGPANEHNYSTGLLLYYFLTGNCAARETVQGLARWVIEMDDGSRTTFRWLAHGNTGLASATASVTYHGPGRGAANSVSALLNAHRIGDGPEFLRKAEQLIRRCIHPADDPGRRDLLDSERRWSYVVFLQTLGRYLNEKAERGELDGAYAYALSSLLAYARWMAEHEYPYLDKPEILEYPTETWAAQDIRKSEVFEFAASHAAGEERERFLERAGFFFDHSIAALTEFKTRTLARPVVLLLSYGFMHAAFHPSGRALLQTRSPAGQFDFGRPEAFVPQKVSAIRRVWRVAALLTLLALSGVSLFLFWKVG